MYLEQKIVRKNSKNKKHYFDQTIKSSENISITIWKIINTETGKNSKINDSIILNMNNKSVCTKRQLLVQTDCCNIINYYFINTIEKMIQSKT